MEGPTASLARHPTLHYCVLAALGAFGVYVSMPIFYRPQSGLERIDLAINLIIFIPSIFIAVVSAILAILSMVFSYAPDDKGRFANFAHTILSAFGLGRLLAPDLVILGPLRLLLTIFAGEHDESTSEDEPPGSGGDTYP